MELNKAGDTKKITAENHRDKLGQTVLSEGENTNKNSTLAGFDLSMLAEEDDDMRQFTPDANLSSDRFVMAKLQNYPNTKRSICSPKINGVGMRLPLGKTVLVRYFYVANAKRSGYLGFKDGVTNRVIDPNHPIFEIKELPPEYDARDVKSVELFRAAINERQLSRGAKNMLEFAEQF